MSDHAIAQSMLFFSRHPRAKFLVPLGFALLALLFASPVLCDRLPGNDQFDKLTAAGDLFKTLDSFVFRVGARLMAGLCVLAAGWNLKEQRFATAVICVVAAIVIATVPMWISNIFSIGGGSIFAPPK
ncbi:MAG: hypothetical protein HYW48_12070 [Deltaproteobacteria bacterium]|nr:hypothetical protein [Deltaproteobacteria bacterium]